jgi:hypothetical protein
MKVLFTIITLIGSAFFLQAQSPVDQGPPQGPLLNRAPEPSQWIIKTELAQTPSVSNTESTLTSSTPAKSAKPRILTVIKSNNLIFEKLLTEYGGEIETWRSSRWTVISANGNGWMIAPSGGNTFNSTDYSKTDFAGFGWIALKNFTGTREVGGKHCLIFKDKVLTLDPQEIATMSAVQAREANPANRVLNLDLLKVDVEADIDFKTRLPVQLIYKTSSGVMTRSYTFESTQATLSVPAGIQQLLQKFQNYQRRLAVPIAPI